MSFADEFAAVDWLVQSGVETSGVDAFALALIKAERQIRRIFTYVIFQNAFDVRPAARRLRRSA